MKRHICLAIITVLLPLSSGAEMLLHSKCAVSPGRTFASVEAVLVEWRELLEKHGYGDYKIRLLMPLSISYDHRLVDGAAAARFLNDVKGYLQAPGRLLLAP